MNTFFNKFVICGTIVLSALVSLVYSQNEMENKLRFGNPTSAVDVYVFTDWKCPFCHRFEPALEEMAPDIMKNARLTFVDILVHPPSKNFIPYNLSFIVNNKKDYLKLRNALTELAKKTDNPTEEEITLIASNAGVKFNALPSEEVTKGRKYFDQLVKEYGVNATPTIVFVNKESQIGQKFGGELTKEVALKTIRELNKQNTDKKIN